MSRQCLYLSSAMGALIVGTGALAQVAATPANTLPADVSVGQSSSGTSPASDQPATQADQAGGSAAGKDGKSRVEERGDIVVTGNRFSKILVQPQSKSIIDAENRNLGGVGDTRQLVDITPGFNYTGAYGVTVRGVGRQTAQTVLGQENPVVEYVDGFIELDPTNIGESTLFGGNVQFLRGPGGTLYGRNSIAGSINLVTRAPTKTFTGEIEGGLGRGGYKDVGINIAGPITDNLGYRLGYQKIVEPSTQENLGTAKNAGFAVNSSYYEFQLEWHLGNFHVRNRATHLDLNNHPAYPTLLGGYNTVPVFGALSPNPQFGYSGPIATKPYQINVDDRGFDRLRGNFEDIINADLDVGFANLLYVGGYDRYHSYGDADRDLTSRSSYDGTQLAPVSFPQTIPAGTTTPVDTIVPTNYTTDYDNHDSYWSQEVRLASKPGTALNWVLGAYHFEQDNNEYFAQEIPGATDVILNPVPGTTGIDLAANPNRAEYEQRNIYHIRSTAVFGNATYNITSKLRLDTGLRYTWDHKYAKTDFRDIFYYPPLFAGDFSPLVHGATPADRNRGLSGRAALAYEFNTGSQVYLAYSRGYQSSAFSLGNILPPGNVSKPEHLDVYELGGSYTVGRFRFDGSVFYQNFHDEQIPVSVFQNLTVMGIPTNVVSSQFFNAKRAVIWGAETEGTWHPNDQSTIVLSYTYLHPKFHNFDPSNSVGPSGAIDITQPALLANGSSNPLFGAPQDLSGNQIPRAPHNKATLYGYYGIGIGKLGHIYPGGSVVYQSGYYTTPFENPLFKVGQRTIVGLTFTYRTLNEKFDVTMSLSNAFRKIYFDDVALVSVGGATERTLSYGSDRYFTFTARYRF